MSLFLSQPRAIREAQDKLTVNSLWTSNTHSWAQSILWSTVHDTCCTWGTFSIKKSQTNKPCRQPFSPHMTRCLQILLLNAPPCNSTWYISPSACQLDVLIWCWKECTDWFPVEASANMFCKCLRQWPDPFRPSLPWVDSGGSVRQWLKMALAATLWLWCWI